MPVARVPLVAPAEVLIGLCWEVLFHHGGRGREHPTARMRLALELLCIGGNTKMAQVKLTTDAINTGRNPPL